MADVDVLVIGGGAMGLATAWQLARRGADVRLVEQYGLGHHEGASHGACRNFNPAYVEPELLALFTEAFAQWRELEGETDTTLLDLVGLVTHGRTPLIAKTAAGLGPAGVPAELLSPDNAQARWPGIRFDGDVLFTPDAGRVHSTDALRALAQAIAARGGELSWNTRVVAIYPDDDGVTVQLEPWGRDRARAAGVSLSGAPDGAGGDESGRDHIPDAPARGDRDMGRARGAAVSIRDHRAREPSDPGGAAERIRCRVVVVATNAWTTGLLGDHIALPTMRVTQEGPVHFPRFDASLDWPSFNHVPGTGDDFGYWWSTVYGMLTPGEGIKAGWHRVGPEVDPDRRSFAAVAQQKADLQRYAREWLPGVDDSFVDEISCTYTSTVDGYFVMDRVGQIVVLAGFGGEGFKFVPAVGRVGADLALGNGDGAAELFSAGRVRRGPVDGTVLSAFRRRQ